MCDFILFNYPEMLPFVDSYGWNSAHWAAKGGNVKVLQLLIKKGISANTITDNELSILHIACNNAKYEMCHYILSEFPDLLPLVNKDGWNAAHCAAYGGSIKILKLLMEKGVSVNHLTNSKMTVLHLACAGAKQEMSQYIITEFPDLLCFCDKDGLNALHYAAIGGNVKIFNLLLEKGLPSDQETIDKMNILHFACERGQYKMFQYILTKFPYMLHLYNKDGLNALHYAAKGGNLKIVQSILRKNISENSTTDNYLIYLACINAKYEMCQYLSAEYPKMLLFVDEDGCNFAHCAAFGGNIKILRLLLLNGILASHTTRNNKTILHFACLYGRSPMCQFILTKFPDMVEMVDEKVWNAAHFAVNGGHVNILRLLIQYKVHVKAATTAKLIIRHIACENNHYKMCQFILSNFPELLHLVDEDGWNAGHCAAMGGNVEILKLLVNAGLQPKQRTHTKSTILHISCVNVQYEICKYILSEFPDMIIYVDERGWNAAHLTVFEKNVEILRLLIERELFAKQSTSSQLNDRSLEAKTEISKYILSK
ncbi:putative ankyrin repeat protein RF_0381 [Saccostrea echinata]|uniref:putative ankyrin repeat protein RF_0381 n=1 Tax=Saccostrea echinata TaxID=191078 RepID=UPI002A8031DA|nr:putative ankyrin repeat protein RF_0381 [Saccostrea echinata]